MAKIVLIGPGNVTNHFLDVLNEPEHMITKELHEIAKVLSEQSQELMILPDKGIAFELATAFKEKGGKKVTALAPLSDKSFGVKHLQEYLAHEHRGKKIFDDTIDTGTWFEHDMVYCLMGETILLLGITLGAMGELAYGLYLYNLIYGKNARVKAKLSSYHKKALAGKKFPLQLIVFRPFLKDKLPFEMEYYIEQAGAKIHYVSTADGLRQTLIQIEQLKK